MQQTITNEGATGLVTLTLPTCAPGIRKEFYVQDSDGIKVKANTGDTIRIGTNVSGTAGYAQSTTVGSALTIVGINATEWVALSYTGTWSVT